MTVGTVSISFSDLFAADSRQTETILFDIRLPRILLAICVGAVLSSTGAVMQGLFRNPLADPSLIGVSSGASVGASLMIVAAGGFIQSGALLGLSLVAVGAFVGGFVATLLVYRLATSGIGTSVTTMLLAATKKLARADVIKVMDDIVRQGFYLQMPPPPIPLTEQL